MSINTITIGVIFPEDDEEGFRDNQERILNKILNNANFNLAKITKINGITQNIPKILLKTERVTDTVSHNNILRDFKQRNIDIIIGGAYSGQARHSKSEIEPPNQVLLLSPTAAMQDLPDIKNLYTLHPNEKNIADIIDNILIKKNKKKIIIVHQINQLGIQRHGYNWATKILHKLMKHVENRDGRVHVITYSTTLDEFDPMSDDQIREGVYESVIKETLFDIERASRIGDDEQAVVFLGHDDIQWFIEYLPKKLKQKGAPKWFTHSLSDSTMEYLNQKPGIAARLRFYHFDVRPDDVAFQRKAVPWALKHNVELGNSKNMNVLWMDALQLLIQSISELLMTSNFQLANLNETISAKHLMKVISDVSSRYYGYSGWCILQKKGRSYWKYDIRAYIRHNNRTIRKIIDTYEMIPEIITAFTPDIPSPPG